MVTVGWLILRAPFPVRVIRRNLDRTLAANCVPRTFFAIQARQYIRALPPRGCLLTRWFPKAIECWKQTLIGWELGLLLFQYRGSLQSHCNNFEGLDWKVNPWGETSKGRCFSSTLVHSHAF